MKANFDEKANLPCCKECGGLVFSICDNHGDLTPQQLPAEFIRGEETVTLTLCTLSKSVTSSTPCFPWFFSRALQLLSRCTLVSFKYSWISHQATHIFMPYLAGLLDYLLPRKESKLLTKAFFHQELPESQKAITNINNITAIHDTFNSEYYSHYFRNVVLELWQVRHHTSFVATSLTLKHLADQVKKKKIRSMTC